MASRAAPIVTTAREEVGVTIATRLPVNLDTSQKAFDYFLPLFDTDQEEVWVAALTSQLEVIARRLIFRGTVDRCHFHARDVFRFAISHNASCLVMAHNHPNGDPTPSEHDFRITRRMRNAGRLLEIAMLDHLIIGGGRFFSFADHRCLSGKRPRQIALPFESHLEKAPEQRSLDFRRRV